MTGTILDTLKGAMRSSGQLAVAPSLRQGLDNYKIRQIMKEKEEEHRKKRENAENRSNAVSDTIPPELDDLSKMFDD